MPLLPSRWSNRRRVSGSYVRQRIASLVQELGKMYFIYSLIMRMPVSMLSLSLLILMSTRTSEITLGGYGAGIIMLSSAVMVPVYLRLSEKMSKRFVLATTSTLNIPAVAYLMMQALQFTDHDRERNIIPFFLATLFVGITIPPFGALSRLRWTKVFNDNGNRQSFNSAIALESIMDVIAIPVGAFLSGAISALASPERSVISVIIFDAIALYIILWLPRLMDRSPRRVLRPVPKPLEGTEPLRWVPLAGISCLGLLLGATESALTSYTVATDSVNVVGFYLTTLGFSGMVVGGLLLFYRVTFSSWRSWLITGILLILTTIMFSTFTSVWGLIILLVLLGGALGVGLICMDSIATSVTPRTLLGSALASMQTTYLGGMGLGLVWGVALGGEISYQASLLIPLIAATLYFLFGHLFGYSYRKVFEERLPALHDA